MTHKPALFASLVLAAVALSGGTVHGQMVIDPSRTIFISGNGLVDGKAYALRQFIIQCRDSHNEDLTNSPGPVNWDIRATRLDGPGEVLITDIVDLNNGTGRVICSYRISVPGIYALSAKANGTPIDEYFQGLPQPIFTIYGPDAVVSTVTGSAITGGKLGLTHTATVDLKYSNGDDFTTGGAPVTAEVWHRGKSYPVSVTDNGDGTFSVVYTPTTEGVYKVYIELAGEQIDDGPWNVQFKKK